MIYLNFEEIPEISEVSEEVLIKRKEMFARRCASTYAKSTVFAWYFNDLRNARCVPLLSINEFFKIDMVYLNSEEVLNKF